MPYRHFTIAELAKHIGMDAREVQKLADKGQLPGQYIEGAWRFHSAELLDWLQHEMHSLADRHLENLERAMSDDPNDVAVSNLLPTSGVELALPAKSRPSVPRELAKVAERTGLLYDPAGLIEALEQREERGSTALAGGFAFPHPRRPDPYLTAEPLICIGRTLAGVPYSAPDGKLTDLFILIVSHEERQHLHLLARLSMLFHNTDLRHRLREAEAPDEAIAAVLACEQQLLAGRK